MEIRYLSEDDSLFDVSNVYEQSWKSAYRNIIPSDYLEYIPKGRWASSLDSSGKYNIVLTDGDSIVGTSCFCRSRWDEFPEYGEIVSLYLLPEYTGKGYGKQLMKRAVKELNGLGFDDILLWTLEENRHARLFYELNGFRYSGKSRTDNIGGKELRELMYIYKGEQK